MFCNKRPTFCFWLWANSWLLGKISVACCGNSQWNQRSDLIRFFPFPIFCTGMRNLTLRSLISHSMQSPTGSIGCCLYKKQACIKAVTTPKDCYGRWREDSDRIRMGVLSNEAGSEGSADIVISLFYCRLFLLKLLFCFVVIRHRLLPGIVEFLCLATINISFRSWALIPLSRLLPEDIPLYSLQKVTCWGATRRGPKKTINTLSNVRTSRWQCISLCE